MRIVCLDLEGVLIPEIWIAFAQKTGVSELTRTTRDEPDYEVLMQYRLDILSKHRFIFNLGHGVLPDTKVKNIKKIIDIVKDYER